MIPDMSEEPSPVLIGVLHLRDDAFKAGAIRNPTRSLLLGAPAGGAPVYGCLIEVDGVDELRDGTTVTASVTFWQPLTPEPPGPVPVWYGHVIGEASELRRVRGRADITGQRTYGPGVEEQNSQ